MSRAPFYSDHDPAALPRQWWETRAFGLVLMLLSTVPLLYPRNAPLVDLFGHMGRYRVQLDLDSSPLLQRFFDFEWAPIGNLGVDVLVELLGPVLGLELAVKLIVLSIPALTVAGFLWVAREVHHRLPPTSLFALLFVYNHPFHFGFVNFALSMALAFLAFGLWLRLARLGRFKLRALLFVPISFVIFFAHAFGWGTLGLLAFSAEAVRQHDSGRGWLRSGLNAALHASVMALPILVVLAWRHDAPPGMNRTWFDWNLKWLWLYGAVRDRWRMLDIATVAVVPLLFLLALVSRRLTLSRNLVFSVLVLAACFVLLPWMMFGSAYADMRLAPYVIALVPLAIRFRGEMHLPMARVIAGVAMALFVLRLGATTLSMTIAANDQQAKLEALEHVPRGARVASLVGRHCRPVWELPRNSHLPGMVIARREGLANDQWAIDGTNLLTIRYPPAGIFQSDPSQMVFPNWCRNLPWARWTIDRALGQLPRDAFDYVWLIDVPPYDPKLTREMTLVWKGRGSMLYRL